MKIFIIILIFNSFLISQEKIFIEGFRTSLDKCGFSQSEEITNESTNNWGYSYDSLLVDLSKWKINPYIKVDSIGLSVQGRPLWQLTISENPNNITNKRTVYIHARTHPQETEGFYVTREILKIITSETDLGRTVRGRCVFYIIPMFNPDGVQLNRPRNNANNIDLESNWFTIPNQPEVAALKARFLQLMNSSNPIEVELNMHSSSLCKRYFVYHDSAGTSPLFAIMQQNYINGIRSYFPNGIEPWNYYISWTNGNPLKYPESWFWLYYGQSVMALTYEDMYQCSGTGKFDSTANALVRGVLDYMNIPVSADNKELTVKDFHLSQNYPNPFNPSTKIRFTVSSSASNSIHSTNGTKCCFVSLKIYDILGNEVATLVNEEKSSGIYEVEFSGYSDDGQSLPSGVYFYRLTTSSFSETKKMILIR